MSILTHFIIALMTSFNISWAGKSDHYIDTVNLEVYIIIHKSIVLLTKMAFLRVHLKYQVLNDMYCSMSKIASWIFFFNLKNCLHIKLKQEVWYSLLVVLHVSHIDGTTLLITKFLLATVSLHGSSCFVEFRLSIVGFHLSQLTD
jgi:hypothetical protein